MARSPSHQFGQLIGDFLEEFVDVLLREFADNHRGLYLDSKSNMRPARKGKKISWTDDKGNIHDLDFVIEKNATDSTIGIPVAFVESAWRRYTKHSRNKAQEIQAAILPLANKYRLSNPFLGVVLAGVFTTNSLEQLRSCGFSILYFPYETLIKVFEQSRIDIAYDENTPDNEFAARIQSLEKISVSRRQRIYTSLRKCFYAEIAGFMDRLHGRFVRQVSRTVILPLFGTERSFASIREALSFLKEFNDPPAHFSFIRLEVQLFFSNGDEMKASFEMKEDAIGFLREYTTRVP